MALGISDSEIFKSIKVRTFTYALIAMFISVLNVAILDSLSVGGMTPDFLLILCVYISIAEGQFYGVVAGFCIGLFFDIVSFDLIGTNALAKTIAGFFAGYFYKEGFKSHTLGSLKLLFIVLFASLLNNATYYLIFIKPMEVNFWHFFTRYCIAMSLYTTIFSIFIMLVYYKRN